MISGAAQTPAKVTSPPPDHPKSASEIEQEAAGEVISGTVRYRTICWG
jgi:hypothetical protein